MTWRLRRADVSDAEALSLVAGATFLEAYSDFMVRADMLAHLSGKSAPDNFRRWIADDASIVTLAEAPAGAAPLGYTVLTAPDLPITVQDDDIELLRLYTLATMWGGGLGAALIERAADDAHAAGYRRLLLGVHGGNTRAHRFYEKHGFALAGTRRFRVGDSWFDDRVYARPLRWQPIGGSRGDVGV